MCALARLNQKCPPARHLGRFWLWASGASVVKKAGFVLSVVLSQPPAEPRRSKGHERQQERADGREEA